jgi:hypothetical protein
MRWLDSYLVSAAAISCFSSAHSFFCAVLLDQHIPLHHDERRIPK